MLTVFIANKYLMRSYYEYKKISEIKETYKTLDAVVAGTDGTADEIYKACGEDKGRFLNVLSAGSNISIVISDSEGRLIVNTAREADLLSMRLDIYREFKDTIIEGKLPNSKFKMIEQTSDYVIQQNFEERTGGYLLECWGTFSDGATSFLISLPVKGITESVNISNRFVFVIGMITLLLGIIVIYFATSKITEPINRLAFISKKMSELDFSERYEGDSEDEIGVLGTSMNSMSETLKTTISDLKSANEQLKEDIDLKEKIDVMRKDFISNVSHELKTPISLIEGYAEGLTEGIAEDPEMRDYYCNVIIDEAHKMNKLVMQLTQLTSYEFEALEPEKEPFDICELIRNCLKHERLKAENAGATVILDMPDKCMVMADEFKIEEVFVNYYTNALNHVSGEKKVFITVKKINENEVKISVYNDGERIPDESLPRLFEKFYKVDKARTRAYGGSGIGLSIVKAIMDAHKKDFGVENKEFGVEFYFVLDYIG
ncbi:MAG: ATP-binding protein [Eubacteriales bacterium]|nr:ATP-binding protein [Eubacteriales bacterium]